MTVRSTLDFDALAEGTVISNGSSALSPWTVNASTAATALAAAAIHGARGLRLGGAGSTGFYQAKYEESAHSDQIVSVTYLRPSAVAAIWYVVACINGATNLGQWRLNTNGTIGIRNGTTLVATTSTALDLSGATAYRIEWMVKAGTDGQELRLYTANGTEPIETITGAWSAATRTGFYFGKGSASNGSGGDFDTPQVADDWVGPFVTTPPEPELTIVNDAICVLGDSTTGMRGNGPTLVANALVGRGWSAGKIQISGITGRLIWGGSTLPTTAATIADWRSDGTDARTWIVGLGANNQGASKANLMSYYESLFALIGPGRVVYAIDYATGDRAENTWTYNSAAPLGARYATAGLSHVNAALRDQADLCSANPGIYPEVVVCNFNDYAPMRAAGAGAWDPTDTSSSAGAARHMSDPGYANYRAPFYALSVDPESPSPVPAVSSAAFFAFV